MSVVTDVVLVHSMHEKSVGSEATYPIHNELNAFFDKDDRDGRTGFVSCDAPELPRGWYGGTKMLQTVVLVGAFNYLDKAALYAHVKGLKWWHPAHVILIVKEERKDEPEVFVLVGSDP